MRLCSRAQPHFLIYDMGKISNLTVAPITRDNNMSAVRYILALMVLIYHFFELAGCDLSHAPNLTYVAVSGFFALSGFLVFGSYCNLIEKGGSINKYILSRARRIMPSYVSIVVLSAVLLCLVSTLPPTEYFTSTSFWEYLGANLTFMNFLHPNLPGVFDGQAVNGSLWTMKVEWLLYLSVPFLFYLLKKFPKHITTILLSVAVFSVLYRLLFFYLYGKTGSTLYEQLGRQLFGQLIYFYLGALVRLKYDWFIRNVKLMIIISAIGTVVSLMNYISGMVIMPFFLVAFIIGISMYGSWGRFASRHENVSYQIYLFHYPVIQTLIHAGVKESLGVFPTFFIALFIIIVLSFYSNRYIDSPIYTSRR